MIAGLGETVKGSSFFLQFQHKVLYVLSLPVKGSLTGARTCWSWQSGQREDPPGVHHRGRAGAQEPQRALHDVQPAGAVPARDPALPGALKKLARHEALVIDDIGYVQYDRDELEVHFTAYDAYPSHARGVFLFVGNGHR